MASPLPILFSDNHLLIVNKPAGLVTQGASAHESSVHKLMSAYIKREYNKPGNVYLGIVSRLDAVTSGIVALARTSKAAARMSEQFRTRSVQKCYLAVLTGWPAGHDGVESTDGWQVWRDELIKDDAAMMMRSVRPGTANAQVAELRVRLLEQRSNGALVQVFLDTGRKHQIRVQGSVRGCPVVGDVKYGGPSWKHDAIALHSAALSFLHPTSRERVSVFAEVPSGWNAFGFRQPSVEDLEKAFASDRTSE